MIRKLGTFFLAMLLFTSRLQAEEENVCSIDQPATCENILLSRAQLEGIHAIVPDMTSISRIAGRGINDAFRVESKSGAKYFVKYFIEGEEARALGNSAENFMARHEATSSQLANYITDGLVPAGTALNHGILYPLAPVDGAATD